MEYGDILCVCHLIITRGNFFQFENNVLVWRKNYFMLDVNNLPNGTQIFEEMK